MAVKDKKDEIVENNKRHAKRKLKRVRTFIRKVLPDGKFMLSQFVSRDLSENGIYIETEDMSLFDLGEDVEIMVQSEGQNYFEGVAQIVRSARIISEEKVCESGYGLLFKEKNNDLDSMLEKILG